jgi:hypothetical protein
MVLGVCKLGSGFSFGGEVAPGQFIDRGFVEFELPSVSMEEAPGIFLFPRMKRIEA